MNLAQVPADDAAHILIVDDDRRIRDMTARFLAREGWRITTAENAADARTHLRSFHFDLLVLDVMMPGESGLDLAAWLRQETGHHAADVPILMLTARAEAADRVRGLEVGADDYLTKPFHPKELVLRIASILRRSTLRPAPVETATPRVLRFGPFTFDCARGDLRHAEEGVRLTDRERNMLRLLAENPGEPVSREALGGTDANERTVDVQINRLRRKIESDPTNPLHLQTARGAGYRLVVDS